MYFQRWITAGAPGKRIRRLWINLATLSTCKHIPPPSGFFTARFSNVMLQNRRRRRARQTTGWSWLCVWRATQASGEKKHNIYPRAQTDDLCNSYSKSPLWISTVATFTTSVLPLFPLFCVLSYSVWTLSCWCELCGLTQAGRRMSLVPLVQANHGVIIWQHCCFCFTLTHRRILEIISDYLPSITKDFLLHEANALCISLYGVWINVPARRAARLWCN